MSMEEVKLVHVVIVTFIILAVAVFIITNTQDRLEWFTDPAFIDTIFANFFGGGA
jgi:hypothetical protein